MPNNNNGRSGMGKNNNGNSNGAGGANGHHRRNVGQLLLAQRFPVNSLQEITLVSNEVVSGRVYCTDEISGTVVLQKALVHTTLAAELRLITATHISKSHVLPDDGADSSSSGTASATPVTPLSAPLPKIQKKALEERERRAIRLAEDSLRHINQSVRAFSRFLQHFMCRVYVDVVAVTFPQLTVSFSIFISSTIDTFRHHR